MRHIFQSNSLATRHCARAAERSISSISRRESEDPISSGVIRRTCLEGIHGAFS